MSKLEKSFGVKPDYPRLNEGVRTGDEVVDIAILIAENRSLRNLAAEILLQSDLLREKLRKHGSLH